jgi:pyruvate/2-oxoglutarate dehydrogenase complex dihydrolipoamide dehydrogenase (E3) component
VEGLHVRGLHVHFFLRGDRYWTAVLDEAESRIVESRLKADGIILHYNTNLAEIRGHNGQLTSVVAQTGKETEEIKCQMLGIAIGIRPRKELADTGKLKTQRGILVDPGLQTSHPDIFAAGDVAQIFDPVSKEHVLDSLWGPALEQGAIAGLNMTGRHEIYQKLIPFNVTRLAGLVITIIGQVGMESPLQAKAGSEPESNSISRGESEIWQQIPDALVAETYAGESHLRLYLSPTRLVGAVIMGNQSISLPIQQIVREKIDIQPLRSRLLEPGARLADLITSFWQERNPIYAAKIA